MRTLVLAAVLCAGACGGGGPDHCFAGDATGTPEIAVVYRDSQGALAAVEPGTALPIFPPPQGGQILLVGVRARNLGGCPLQISTALVDTETAAVTAFEGRPIMLEPAPGEAEWLQPKQPELLSNFSNLPACPVAGLTRPIDDMPYELRVEVEDAAGRQAATSVTVVPTCGGNVFCHCQCAVDYVLGSACP